jgi:Skp family chaperone for outer membrane proteins
MTKKVLYIALGFLLTLELWAQKPQRIAYIDMEYILENIPEYQSAQSQLDSKVANWQDKLAKMKGDLEVMEAALANERALLTHDLIVEREEDIDIKRQEYRDLQSQYFGTEGDLFRLRQQLVKPVQDQVFNAIQEIAKNRSYDFVLDKSSDLIMLYSNDKYDISDMVVKAITKNEKIANRKEKQKAREEAVQQDEPTEAEIKKQAEIEAKKVEKEAKRQEMLDKIEKQKAERAKKREEQLKAIEEARQKKIKEREEARRKLEEKRAAEKKAREENQENEQDGNNN